MMRNKNKSFKGFTLIELLVVVAIIALLSSVIMMSVISARQKSRDVKRLSDMTQMNTGLELFFATYRGYPTGTSGVPQNLTPYVANVPAAPTPPDGICEGLFHNSDSCTAADPNCTGKPQNQYYYVASGTPYSVSGQTVYPDYAYFFCLGDKTGNFLAGPRILTPKGVR
jgi:prepilin-type N-terminal cleavage/methylation domain-containing protein